MDYFHVCITVITFISLFHLCIITFINHFILFTPDAQQAEDNYPMFYWTINLYRIVSEEAGKRNRGHDKDEQTEPAMAVTSI